jgi:hypothetical protein
MRLGEDARRRLGICSVGLMVAGVVGVVVGAHGLAAHGGVCANGVVYVPRHDCGKDTASIAAFFGGGIVAMVLGAVAIAFTLGPSSMFVALGGAFLAGSVSLLAGGVGLVAMIAVWGLIGVVFVVIGVFGIRSDRRARARPEAFSWPE